jgi:phage terminase large subunit-like protein
MAEEADEDPRALWSRDIIEASRVFELPEFDSIVVGVDPPGTPGGECGILVAGMSRDRGRLPLPEAFLIDDLSRAGRPGDWSKSVLEGYFLHEADAIVVESNFGGDMVETTIRNAEGGKMVPIVSVRASRGKSIRAEPVASLYDRGLIHHFGNFDKVEDEMCTWVPGERRSPNRLDALVWAMWRLLLANKDYGPAGAVPYV